MSSQNEAMIDPLRLVILQRRQIRHRRRFRLIQNPFRHRLQCPPTRPLQIWCMRNLPQQTAPLNDHPINISRSDQVAHPSVLIQRILVHRRHNLLRSCSIFRRRAVLKIARDRLQSELLVANHRQPSAATILIPAKPKSGIQIRQIINQFVQRVTLIFLCRRNCQAITL